jgi:CMP/dCMP kinase
MSTKPNYTNITISGLPGAGSSTLGKKLAKKLGWKYYCGGDFMRTYAIEKGLFDKNSKNHHSATVYDDDFDRHVDFQARMWLQEKEDQILDAWLSGFMAQEVKGVLKVLVYCSEDAVRVDRIVNRDEVSVEKAKKHIFQRERENLSKWQRMYKKEWHEWVIDKKILSKNDPIYFWDKKLYDLALDTYKLSRKQTLDQVLKVLGR